MARTGIPRTEAAAKKMKLKAVDFTADEIGDRLGPTLTISMDPTTARAGSLSHIVYTISKGSTPQLKLVCYHKTADTTTCREVDNATAQRIAAGEEDLPDAE